MYPTETLNPKQFSLFEYNNGNNLSNPYFLFISFTIYSKSTKNTSIRIDNYYLSLSLYYYHYLMI